MQDIKNIKLSNRVAPDVTQVYLVGAGPGDPELLSLKAARVLKECDIVMYDRLVNPVILNYAPGAQHIAVGKIPGRCAQGIQQEIQKKLLEYARQGLVTVRLKGGDPFVFGRGGEEALALHAAGIAFEIVPGISSIHAVPAMAGIPVTHRGLANSFAVFTGHGASGDINVDWELAARIPTAIFLMGVRMLPVIIRQLLAHGRALHTPVAIISNGTYHNQICVSGTLQSIFQDSQEIQSPATIIVGDVVGLRQQIANRDLHQSNKYGANDIQNQKSNSFVNIPSLASLVTSAF